MEDLQPCPEIGGTSYKQVLLLVDVVIAKLVIAKLCCVEIQATGEVILC